MSSITSISTLVEWLCDRAQQCPEQSAFTVLKSGEIPQPPLSYRQLDQRARAIAARLQTQCSQGDRALLIYPYDAQLEFIVAFLGCLYAGVIAVPSHPPRNRYAFTDLSQRYASADPAVILAPASLQTRLQRQWADSEGDMPLRDRWLIPETIPDGIETDWIMPQLEAESLAFLQFTSGSTGTPKGVQITHAGLQQNQRLLQQAFGHTAQSVGVGWLPLFHDMGLIGNVLQTVYLGASCVLMSPIDFIQKPIRWLQAIAQYGATTSGGPNFAYDLLCRQVTEAQLQTLDLQRWQVAFSGAEPVRLNTLERFATKFAPCGFRREAFYPCYGMAEATLFISGGQKERFPTVKIVDERGLHTHQVQFVERSHSRARSLVSCGRGWLDTTIKIVNPITCIPCPEEQVGEIWVTGSGLGRGYWQQPEETDRTFAAHVAEDFEGQSFLRTGDLGFWSEGELFITGRLHDVLVFWGFNHYPQHLEQTVQACHPSFREAGTAAIAIPVQGEDRLVILQEVERRDRHSIQLSEVVEPIRWAIFQNHFVDVGAIVLLKPGALPKTPSGKLQRRTCRTQYLEGGFEVLAEWRLPDDHLSDIPSLIRRYLNPLTHIRRYRAIAQRHVRQWLQRS